MVVVSSISDYDYNKIKESVANGKEFSYLEFICNDYSIPFDENIINRTLDDYNRLSRTQSSYYAKVNALRIATIRVKYYYLNPYTDYEDVE